MAIFYDREKEEKTLRLLLGSEPNAVYFVYGPINSGKTALLTKVLQELQENTIPFYINLRRRDISTIGDFINVLFTVDKRSAFDNAGEYIQEFGKAGADAVKKLTGIPIPLKIFDLLFKTKDKGEDAFRYLEEFFYNLLNEKKLKPILVLDELQMIKQLANASGIPLVEKLFNFMVGMTKETHLCHCLASTSDCLFIEEIYGNARLEGRCQYFFVDDLDKKRAFDVYKNMGFKDLDMIWDYIGGKLGDIMLFSEGKRLKADEMETAREMLQTEVMRIRMFLRKMEIVTRKIEIEGESKEVNIEEVKDTLREVTKNQNIFQHELSEIPLRCLIKENILFLHPQTGGVRFQGRLIEKAVKTLEGQKHF